MDVIDRQPTEPEAELMQANSEELVERIARVMREDGITQSLEGLHLTRSSFPLERVHSVIKPSVCVIAEAQQSGG